MTERTITFRVPGQVYEDALNPAATAMEGELGLPEPSWRRVGRWGYSYTYRNVPLAVARELYEYLRDRAELMLAQDFAPEDKRTYYAMRQCAEKIESLLEDG